MMRVTHGGFTVDCDTEAEVRIAIAALSIPSPTVELAAGPVADPNGYTSHLEVPGWRVGGPVSEHEQHAHTAVIDADPAKRTLALVEQANTKIAQIGVPEMVPVTRVNLDVLEAVLCFQEGVPTRGLMELLGLKQTTVSGRLGTLQRAGLIERVQHKNLWRATTLARRAKLVAS